MPKIDPGILPCTYDTKTKKGVFVSLHPDGSLAHVGYYPEQGKPCSIGVNLEHDSLVVSEEKHELVRVDFAESRGEGDVTPEEAMRSWLDGRLASIARAAGSLGPSFDCAFCGKGRSEVKKIIAGPEVSICNECVRLCADILAEEGPT